MEKPKNLKKVIIPYAIGTAIVLASIGTIILMCLLAKGRFATFILPAFAPPKLLFCMLCALCALPQIYTIGNTLKLKQMPTFYTFIAVHFAMTIWALLFYLGVTLPALAIVFATSVTLNVTCFRLTNKKGARWLLTLPYALWILYLLFLNYAIVLLN